MMNAFKMKVRNSALIFAVIISIVNMNLVLNKMVQPKSSIITVFFDPSSPRINYSNGFRNASGTICYSRVNIDRLIYNYTNYGSEAPLTIDPSKNNTL